MEVKFYDTVNDELLKFAVIISQSNGKWVFCKHKERDTYEVPGGHREAGEDIFETAKRELQEETGAIKFEIKPICVYSVTGKTRVNDTGEETFGLLCFAEITEFAKELHSEMEKVVLMDELPENWTYPLIQPKLIEKYLQVINFDNKGDNQNIVNIGELMYKSFMNGMYQSFIIIGPYIIGSLIVAFIGLVIKKISEEFTYYFSIISGDSRRIARKKAKKMSKMVDMISSFKDIIDNTKNK